MIFITLFFDFEYDRWKRFIFRLWRWIRPRIPSISDASKGIYYQISNAKSIYFLNGLGVRRRAVKDFDLRILAIIIHRSNDVSQMTYVYSSCHNLYVFWKVKKRHRNYICKFEDDTSYRKITRKPNDKIKLTSDPPQFLGRITKRLISEFEFDNFQKHVHN